MQLYEEILLKALANQTILVRFPDLEFNPEQIIKDETYRLLNEIKRIIHDDTIEDEECFIKIEEIICAFESAGSNGGFRHDF